MPDQKKRRGLLAGGNWLVDHVKIIDQWPAQDTLATISAQSDGNGEFGLRWQSAAATPLWRTKSGVALRFPPQSKIIFPRHNDVER